MVGGVEVGHSAWTREAVGRDRRRAAAGSLQGETDDAGDHPSTLSACTIDSFMTSGSVPLSDRFAASTCWLDDPRIEL